MTHYRWITSSSVYQYKKQEWLYIFGSYILSRYRMMTSSNGNIYRVTGPLCGNSPITREFPSQRPVMQSFNVLFDLHLKKNGWVNNWDAGGLRRHCAHYDVTIMAFITQTDTRCSFYIPYGLYDISSPKLINVSVGKSPVAALIYVSGGQSAQPSVNICSWDNKNSNLLGSISHTKCNVYITYDLYKV